MDRQLYRRGLVVSRNANAVEIEFDAAAACRACHDGYGCGIGPLIGLFRSTPRCRVQLDDRQAREIYPGEEVRVGIAARTMLVHVALVYLLPLLGLFVGALGATVAVGHGGDVYAVVGGVIGLGLAHVVARLSRAALRLDAGLRARTISPIQ